MLNLNFFHFLNVKGSIYSANFVYIAYSPTSMMHIDMEIFILRKYFLVLRDVENINIRFKRGSSDYEEKMRKSLKEFLPHYFDVIIFSIKSF